MKGKCRWRETRGKMKREVERKGAEEERLRDRNGGEKGKMEGER